MADIRLELAREEVTEPARIQSVGTNEFLYKGLELEELQYVPPRRSGSSTHSLLLA